MKDELSNLLQKQMDRKAFLKHVGVGVAAMTGMATIVKTLNSLAVPGEKTQVAGYGASLYGGDKVQKAN